jgi:membrane protease YdiL (CAAX protease family)
MRPLALIAVLFVEVTAHAQADRYSRAADAAPRVRAQAAEELAEDPSRRAGDLLYLMLLRDVDEGVREIAARALERRRDPNYGAVLEHAARHDPSPRVRAAAGRAREKVWAFSKRPRLAAGFGLLCPGCGHFYLQRHDDGLAYLGATGAMVGGALLLVSDNDDGPHLGDPERLDSIDPEDPLVVPLVIGAQNLWFYSIFDAYRDARRLRDDHGYQHPISRETLPELASAPFRPSVLKSPWVWGAVPLALGLGLGLSYLVEPEDLGEGRPSIFDVDRVNVFGRRFSPGAGFALGEVFYASLFLPVGVGEEALFRGFIQSEMSEAWGPWGGWAGASVVFGAVHVFNFLQPGANERDALFAVPFITAVGSTLGLAYMHTGYRLETSVAMHFWYDFALGTASFITDPEHQPFIARFGTTF